MYQQKYVIVGAGGFGRELACWIMGAGAEHANRLVGFLDDVAPDLPANLYPPILGTVQDPPRQVAGCDLLIAIGEPAARERTVEHLTRRGAIFGTFVHPSAVLAHSASVMKGTIICPNAVLSADCRLGEHVIVNIGCSIGHDVEIGDYTTLSSQIDLTGKVKVGRRCFFGSRAGALPGVEIGDDCLIGAGAIVVRKLAAMATVYEQPPRYLHKQ